MVGGAAYGLNDPNRLPGARILPRQLSPHSQFIIDIVILCQVAPGFKANHLVTFLAKLVGERPATRSRTDHHDDAGVIEFIFRSHTIDPHKREHSQEC